MSMFEALSRIPVVAILGGDLSDITMPIYRVPDNAAPRVMGGCAAVPSAVAASTANFMTLQLINMGTAGDGTAVIGSAIGGTAGWAAGAPKEFAPNDYNLQPGELVGVKYDETGTVNTGQIAVQLDLAF